MRTEKILFYCLLITLLLVSGTTTYTQFPRFKVLAFYSKYVETDHVEFAFEAIRFFKDLSRGNVFVK